ncbi:hypothetical protein Tco_1205118, partial [Tanacetum coccineum]
EAIAAREAWAQSMDASDTTRFEAQLMEALTLLRTLQTQMVALQSQQRPTRDPTHPGVPEEAGSTEGVVGLTQWFKRMETVFNISNCVVENQVKFDTCTLHCVALTWCKSHVKTVGQDAAHNMRWNTLMKMMTELALMCGRMFPKESDKIEKYVDGLPNMIHGSVMASKPNTMQDAVKFATELMDKKIRTFEERQVENKRKFEDTSRNYQNQQQQNKRQNTGRAYTAGSGKKKPYRGSKPLCSKCNYHHDKPCSPKCRKCNRVFHLARDCRSPANANTANNQRGTEAGQKYTFFECEARDISRRSVQS